jgi:hypothetical protein
MPAVTLNFQNPSFTPAYPIGLILNFLEDSLWECDYVHGATQLEVCMFHQCSFCHIHGECYRCTVLSVVDLFLAWFSCVNSKSVCSFEDHPNVMLILYTFELLWNTLHIWNIHRDQRLFFFIRTTTLGINNRVNETLRITVQLKNMSQATNFIKQILSFLAYGGSPVVKTLN